MKREEERFIRCRSSSLHQPSELRHINLYSAPLIRSMAEQRKRRKERRRKLLELVLVLLALAILVGILYADVVVNGARW